MKVGVILAAAFAVFSCPAFAQQIQPADFTGGSGSVKDPAPAVSLQLPQGWKLVGGQRWGEHETTLLLADARSGILVSLYYKYPLPKPSPNPWVSLQQGIDAKVRQPQGEGMTDYYVLPGSIRNTVIGGFPSASFLGGFTRAGNPESEFMLRVLGRTTKANFFLPMAAGTDVKALLERLAL